MYHLVKLEHLLTSYVCVCAASRPAETVLPHIRVTIVGKEGGKKDTWKVEKIKFTSVAFLYLDVTIWDHMANVSLSSII